MVGFIYNPTSEEVEEEEKIQPFSELNKQNDPFSLSVPDFDDSFLTSADFDSIKDLILDSSMAEVKQEAAEFGSEQVEFSTMDKNNELGTCEISEKSEIQKEVSVKLDSLSCLKVEKSECVEVGNLGCIVEEGIGKVSINATEDERIVDQDGNRVNIAEADIGNCSIVSDSVAAVVSKNEESDEVAISSRTEERSVDETRVNGSTMNGDKLKGGEDGSSSDTESESESSASSSASSSDGESSSSEEEEGEVDMEEGEIQVSDPDEMVAWNEDDDTGVKGPIRSKNEVQALPPVPAVTVTLQPHHQMLPVGVVSSIIGAQVVVEGVEKHTPLYDGSILWITESRSPLGIVDEIFGPVKNPYYIVRYNSDNEVPTGINPGTLISFVPEFSELVLNDNSLYKKGYDASGENDEEVSEAEEFSDDEKEAEYKRMLKMKKRGATNDQKPGNNKDKRKPKNKSQNWKHNESAAADVQRENARPPFDQSQHFISTAAGSLDQGVYPNSSFHGHGQSSRPPSVSLFPPMEKAPGQAAPSTGVWTNGIPYQQPQNMSFPNALPTIGMPWPQQIHQQQMFPMPSPNAVPFEQQMNPTHPSPFIFPGGQPNFGAGPSFLPWPALGQNVFNQPQLSMGQMTPTPLILGGQVPVNGPQMVQNNNSQPNAAGPGAYINGSPNFNQGTHSGGGRRGNHRGGGRFGGRRGRTQRN
nr:PREDICTED: H/ACA ribonucleoprotein complex non-core subunit NAF1-like [Nicotiana tabacum]